MSSGQYKTSPGTGVHGVFDYPSANLRRRGSGRVPLSQVRRSSAPRCHRALLGRGRARGLDGEHAGNAWSGGPRAFVTDAADVLVVPKAALWLPRRDRGSRGGGMFACCRRDALRERSLRAQRCRVLVAHPGSAALVSESVGPSSTASRGPVRTWFRHGPRCATRSSGGPHE